MNGRSRVVIIDRVSSPGRWDGPLPHPGGVGIPSVNPSSGPRAPVGRGVGRRDGGPPHGDDALGLFVDVVDGGGLLGSEVIQTDDEVVDDLALKGRGEVPNSEPLGDDQRSGERSPEAVEDEREIRISILIERTRDRSSDPTYVTALRMVQRRIPTSE